MFIWMVTGLLVTHFIADFLLQTDWMALNKSKNRSALLCHTLVYSCCFLWCGPWFAMMTFLLHTLTDAVTSRWTSKLWFMELVWDDRTGYSRTHWVLKEPNPRHWFFVVIGLDQLIHGVSLLWTLKLLNP